MPKKAIDYSKCIIYKIVCNDYNVKDLYVGHTTDLVKRRSCHKFACNHSDHNANHLKIYKTIRENGGWENWSVVVVENYETCKDMEDARTRERFWFDELNARMNSYKPILTDDEKSEILRQSAKKHYEKNKESILNRHLEYYYKNKDSIKEYTKRYYEENKDNLAEYRKKNRLKMKEYRERNKEKIKEYREKTKDKMKQYYLDNKEKIIETQKEYKKQKRQQKNENVELKDIN
jgi:hypothetical protein